MSTKNRHILHSFGGGWATDLGTYYAASSSQDAVIPFLLEARNVIYNLDKGPRKAPGTVPLNDPPVAAEGVRLGTFILGLDVLSTPIIIKGLVDFWRSGTAGVATQQRVLHIGAEVHHDDANGIFKTIKSGLEVDAIPSYTIFGDFLIYASTSTVDVPQRYNGTANQDLAGTPPNFSFSVVHKGRVWAGGVAATPSRLFYSALNKPEDWIGAGSGTIDIDTDDGDQITGLVSHKDALWIFKGPNKGSIHRVVGSAPTGEDPFALRNFTREIGAVGHNSIFRFRDDIGFLWSDGSVYSLTAVELFGDFSKAALTRAIRTFIDEHLNFSRLQHAWAATLDTQGAVVFTLPIDGSLINNIMLMMDYREDPPLWSLWDAFSGGCIAPIIDSADRDRHILMAGGNDGVVRKLYQSQRSIDGTGAIPFKIRTPFTDYGSAFNVKTVEALGLLLVPHLFTGDVELGWERDSGGLQTVSLELGGAKLGLLVLGTDVLGTEFPQFRFAETEEGGEFRLLSFTASNDELDVDADVNRIAAAISFDSVATEVI